MERKGLHNMNFTMIHENYNVSDLDASIAFYDKALGLKEVRRKTALTTRQSSLSRTSRTPLTIMLLTATMTTS